jgi:PAS domain S-box-containing protein
MLQAGNHRTRSTLGVLSSEGAIARDIRDSESYFRVLADCAPVVVWMTDPQGRCTYISRYWKELTGRNPKRDFGYRRSNALHPEDRSRAVRDLLEAVRTRSACEGEYRVRRANGEYAWVFDHGIPYFHTDGTYAGHVGTCVDITVRKNREAERVRIHDSLLLGQEAERKRIARELHDDIGQRLALLGVTLTEIEQLSLNEAPAIKDKLREARECVDSVASETHLMSHNLHPAMLTHLGLVLSLRRLCKDFSARKQLSVEFNGDHVSEDLPQEISTALFRIAQECLTNVAKHSGAREARVELSQNRNRLQLTVTDFGRGFDATQELAADNGLGLISVRERVRMIGGEIEIDSAPSKGAKIRVCVQTQKRFPQAIAA